jgi:hypothetical protein
MWHNSCFPLLPGKEHPILVVLDTGCAPKSVWTLVKSKISAPDTYLKERSSGRGGGERTNKYVLYEALQDLYKQTANDVTCTMTRDITANLVSICCQTSFPPRLPS